MVNDNRLGVLLQGASQLPVSDLKRSDENLSPLGDLGDLALVIENIRDIDTRGVVRFQRRAYRLGPLREAVRRASEAGVPPSPW